MRFLVLGASNVKSIFIWGILLDNCLRFIMKYVLELQIALAKIKSHLFENYKENP